MKKEEISSIDALIEKPITFSIEDRDFSIVPPSLGKMNLLSRYLVLMDIDEDAITKKPIKEAARLLSEHIGEVLRFMSLAVSNTKDELQDEEKLKDLDDFFRWHSDASVFADIVKIVIAQSDYANFTAAIRLMQIYKFGISTAREEGRIAE